MFGELAARFVLGGAIVSAFAMLGTVFKPKTFAGLFSAAPSVGIATLGMAFAQKGADYAGIEARAMVCGTLGMLGYCATCIALAKAHRVPVWLAAGVAWLTWFAVALAALWVWRGVAS